MYRRLKQKNIPPIEHSQPATLAGEPRPLPPGYEVELMETDDLQVDMSNWHLVSTDQQTEEEPVIVTISGKVVEFLSCRRLETLLNIQLEDFMQTFCEVTRDYRWLWPDGQEDSAHWDVRESELSYEALIRYLRQPANQTSIKSEMSEIQMPLSFLDILYELVLFGWFQNGYAPDFVDGGFLDSLYRHIVSWDTETWEPAADQCFTIIEDQLTEFLVAVFSQPLELYEDTGHLANV